MAFGLFADGLTSAILLWGLAGIGFAGAYMPGLRALTDRLGPGDISRSVTMYTATLLLRRRPVLPRLAADCRASGLALRLPSDRVRAAGDDRRLPGPGAGASRPRRAPGCSISVRCCATVRRWATSWATAPIASSSTACARGSSPSGRSSLPATAARRCSSLSRSASWSRSSPCRPASSATKRRSAGDATAPLRLAMLVSALIAVVIGLAAGVRPGLSAGAPARLRHHRPGQFWER